jgi:hypothetical protein
VKTAAKTRTTYALVATNAHNAAIAALTQTPKPPTPEIKPLDHPNFLLNTIYHQIVGQALSP